MVGLGKVDEAAGGVEDPSVQRSVFPLVVALLLSSGCATLFADSADQIRITSSPEGAQVLMDGMPVGHTPVTLTVDRDTFATHYITLRAPNYRSLRFPLQHSLETVALLNLSSVLSWGIDALSGNMLEYAPSSYFFDLPPAGPGPAPAGPGWDRAPGGGWSRSPEWRARRRFVLVNHRTLLRDIARGTGEHLDELARLYGIEPGGDDFRALARRLAVAMPELLETRYPHRLHARIETMVCQTPRWSAACAPRASQAIGWAQAGPVGR